MALDSRKQLLELFPDDVAYNLAHARDAGDDVADERPGASNVGCRW